MIKIDMPGLTEEQIAAAKKTIEALKAKQKAMDRLAGCKPRDSVVEVRCGNRDERRQ